MSDGDYSTLESDMWDDTMPALMQTQFDLAGSVVGKAVGCGVVEGALVGCVVGTALHCTVIS